MVSTRCLDLAQASASPEARGTDLSVAGCLWWGWRMDVSSKFSGGRCSVWGHMGTVCRLPRTDDDRRQEAVLSVY